MPGGRSVGVGVTVGVKVIVGVAVTVGVGVAVGTSSTKTVAPVVLLSSDSPPRMASLRVVPLVEKMIGLRLSSD